MANDSYFESKWRYLHEDVFNKSDFSFFMVSQYVLTLPIFWGLCGFFFLADFTGRPRWMLQYKVQKDQNVPVDVKRVIKAAKVSIFNIVVVNTPFLILLFAAQKYMSCTYAPEDLPSPLGVFKDLVGCVIANEIGFYYGHRLMHWGPLYRRVHKIHHEWTAPTAIVSIYAHPVEQVVANMMPFTLGPVLMSSHLLTQLIWYSIALPTLIVHHSGYHLPLLPSPEFHDYHHLKFNVNYGVVGFLDWLHGTDKSFRKAPQFHRHRTLFRIRPLCKTFPDAPKRPDRATEPYVNGAPHDVSTGKRD